MGRLERRQAGAVSASVLGFVLVVSAALLSLVDRNGILTFGVGVTGGLVMLVGVIASARVSREMIHAGRR
ncbi:MAG: hypothetical protein QGH42_01000 [Kiritimatiellia bacterium]|jgi:hypothetical protein|nr:hypothetical protein [Kiritimatiellia bacterium]MDP6631539.1 hypothetical protein [Kiritimatiellia bacterium]MDP6810599.1 hypothetical protein [Kiritimatiellia bacterium]MDP7022814.1 hypothetical protein [Kiritimatiellia bacterium]